METPLKKSPLLWGTWLPIHRAHLILSPGNRDEYALVFKINSPVISTDKYLKNKHRHFFKLLYDLD